MFSPFLCVKVLSNPQGILYMTTTENLTMPNEADDTIKVNPTDELIILVLKNKELYGLQIVSAIAEASNGQQSLKIGSLYPVLHRLERRGLVESRWSDRTYEERGGARRRYYKLTQDGNAVCDRLQSFRENLLGWQPI